MPKSLQTPTFIGFTGFRYRITYLFPIQLSLVIIANHSLFVKSHYLIQIFAHGDGLFCYNGGKTFEVSG
jgi:hypothetical protein